MSPRMLSIAILLSAVVAIAGAILGGDGVWLLYIGKPLTTLLILLLAASAAPSIVGTAKGAGASALFLTADTAGALPVLSQSLVAAGLDTATMKFLGLTRWDIPSQTLSLPALQGSWFALPDPNLYAQFQSRYMSAYGATPLPISGLAYDGIAAIGALAKQGRDLSGGSLTQNAGFVGVSGIFRLRSDGSNERGLAIAEIRQGQAVVVDPAPRSFAGAGF